jgi:hypothetical protein
MSYINASTANQRVKLFIIKASDATVVDGAYTYPQTDFYSATNNTTGVATLNTTTDPIQLPGLQDITINNANGSYRWKQLDQAGENVITTNATNSLSGNFVIDTTAFWGDGTATADHAAYEGLFKLSNDRTPVVFLIAPSGVTDTQTVLMGNGFISALAPTVSADSPVWVSPITLEVNGDYTKAVVTLGA